MRARPRQPAERERTDARGVVPVSDDPLVLESRVPDGRDTYRFHTAAGVHSHDEFREGELVALEALAERDLGALRVLEGNYGVVGTVLGARAASTALTETSVRAAALCARNLRTNGVDGSVSLMADRERLDRRVDTTVYAPRPYTPLSLGSQRIANGLAGLRPGGRFFLAASNRQGRRRYRERLETLAEDVERVAERGSVAVIRATRPAEFDPPTYVHPRRLTPTVDGVDLDLTSLPGCFAASGLDDGTRLLLETVSVDDGDRVLDCCCGYGPCGVYAGLVADCELWLTDDDANATWCARRSLEASGVDGTVVTADCLDGVADPQFDRIICNPPTHAGAEVLSSLFAGARTRLRPGGELAFVHHRALDVPRYLEGFSTVRVARTGANHVVVLARR